MEKNITLHHSFSIKQILGSTSAAYSEEKLTLVQAKLTVSHFQCLIKYRIKDT